MHNFGKNVIYKPRHRYTPRTDEEVLAILAREIQPLTAAEIAPLYPGLERFREICLAHDPNDVFQNASTNMVMGLGGSRT